MSVEPLFGGRGAPALTMTLGELMDVEGVLTRLLEVRLSAKTAYAVAKLARFVQMETSHFKAKRDDLIKEFGEPIPDQPGAVKVTEANTSLFMQKVRELAEVEVTLTVSPLHLADLPEMTGSDLLKLGPLVTD